MFLKNPKIRRFEYIPRFFNPEPDDEDETKRIKFRRLIDRRANKGRSFIGMIVLIFILIFLIRYLHNISKAEKEEAPIREIKIEIIE